MPISHNGADILAVKVSNPEKAGHLCAGCGGRCCRLRVDLTIFDIVRIAVLAKRPADDFVQLVEAKPDDALAVRCLGRSAKAVLRHKDDGTCVFLNGNDVKGCDIEDAKPAICLAYPFALEKGRPHIRRDALCPPGNLRFADLAKMSATALDDCDWETAFYRETVEDWNMMAKGNEPFGQFFAFSGNEIELNRWPLIGGRLRSLIRRLRRALGRLRRQQESPQGSR